MRIAIDFDGTIVEHKFPAIGRSVPGAFEWMKKWKEAGARLILWTMRSDRATNAYAPGEEAYLTHAVQFCRDKGVEFDAVNAGIDDWRWTTSPKAFAKVYVDDAAFGCPLIPSNEMGARPMVDWSVVGPAIMEQLGR
jgi:hypothetical protein